MHEAQLHALSWAIETAKLDRQSAPTVLLDFGCGAGRWTDYFKEFCSEYVGVDISDQMIALSRSRHPDEKFETLDGLTIPLSDDSCDLAFSVAVIHHNENPDQVSLLRELARVLKPGGRLFMFEALGSQQKEREFPHPMQEWVAIVEGNSFECISKRGYSYFVLTNMMNNIAKRLRIPRMHSWRPNFLLRIDAILSPMLSRFLPESSQIRGAMLFRRREKIVN